MPFFVNLACVVGTFLKHKLILISSKSDKENYEVREFVQKQIVYAAFRLLPEFFISFVSALVKFHLLRSTFESSRLSIIFLHIKETLLCSKVYLDLDNL